MPHFIHVGGFQSFAADAFAAIISEVRKFVAYFCLANQYTKQIPKFPGRFPISRAWSGSPPQLFVFDQLSAALASNLFTHERRLVPQALCVSREHEQRAANDLFLEIGEPLRGAVPK